jgi:periplasmic divalent cation tolerance protein
MTKEAVTIITTVALGEDAVRIAEMLLRDKLAACVQEVKIKSRYRWKDEIRCEPEVLLLVKTARDRAEAAVTAIHKIHPYELPEIIVLPVVGGLADYLTWINVETREQ